MSPTVLVVGATGNTGVGVIETLSKTIKSSQKLSEYRIIGLTRDKTGSKAKELSELPHVEMIEKDWTMITDEWLKDHQVERLFIAPHNGTNHFTDESLFLNYALVAGVKYAVKISTTKGNVAPNTKVFYAREHWAIETMLEQPEFKAMGWTSLQPNVFTGHFAPVLTGWLEAFRKTGKQQPLKLIVAKDAPVAVVNSVEVGIAAAHLLGLDDTTPHHSKKYVVVGPTNITGKDMVDLVEKHAGTKVEDVTYEDKSWLESPGVKAAFPANVLPSLAQAPVSGFNGSASVEVDPTSPELAKLYAPKRSAIDELDVALAKV
jgi:uncharacterized protein YbjT (DUF2867 family)